MIRTEEAFLEERLLLRSKHIFDFFFLKGSWLAEYLWTQIVFKIVKQKKWWKISFYYVNNSPQLITTFNKIFLNTIAEFLLWLLLLVTSWIKNVHSLKYQCNTYSHIGNGQYQEHWQYQMLVRMRSNRNSYSLWVEMQNGNFGRQFGDFLQN